MYLPSLLPGAVVLLAVDALGEVSRRSGAEFGRDTWIRQALIEELLQALPSGGARNALSRLHTTGRGITEAAADGVFVDLSVSGWLIPHGVRAGATWEVNETRRAEIETLWSTLTDPEKQSVLAAAHRTMAVSVAWSKRLRTRGVSSTSTSTSSTP